MRGINEVNQILSERATLCLAQHPHLDSTLARMVARRELVSPLPGIFIRSEKSEDLPTLAAAALTWRADAVITGLSAARLTYWPGQWRPPLDLFTTRRTRTPTAHVRFNGLLPAPEWILESHGIRVTHPALSAVWLAAFDHGEAIDNGIRLRAFKLTHLNAALAAQGGRKGNETRRAVLRESRDEPWSPPERKAHAILRKYGVTGWKANHRVVAQGHVYYLDLAFPRQRIAFEIDGWRFHSTPEQTLYDNARNNDLVLEDWVIFHIAPGDLLDEQRFIALIHAALRSRHARRTLGARAK